MKTVTIDSIELTLAKPVTKEFKWIGQAQPQRELEACWLVISDDDLPLTPRLVGVPGAGKTTLAAATAQLRKQPVYIMQCTADTRPEDLIVTPVLSSEGKISYHASPLLSAVITGGIAILDEGNRMSEKSWASLAGLLDHRRFVESIVAGITIEAHKDFRCVVTMNEDDSTFEIPDYIISRLQPQIRVGFPSREEELAILKYNIPFATDEILDLCVSFLQRSHELDLPHSIRDGLNAIRYALKEGKVTGNENTEELFENAIKKIIGESYLTLQDDAALTDPPLYDTKEMSLGDFYFGEEEDDDLNPDYDDYDDMGA